MLKAIMGVIGAIITAAIVNKLLHEWQQRAWYAQQRHIGKTRELDDIQKLFDELNERANARLTANRFFLRNIGGDDEQALQNRLNDYREEVFTWMAKLSSFFARLTLLLSHEFTLILEQEIHSRLRRAGAMTEILYHRAKEGKTISGEEKREVEDLLNSCQGAINDLSRDIMRLMIEKRSNIISGRRLEYTRSNLNHFTTLELIEALFIPRIETHYVIRPS